MNISEYKGVFVFAQQVDGIVGGIAFELVGEGKKLANDLGVDVTAILIGTRRIIRQQTGRRFMKSVASHPG